RRPPHRPCVPVAPSSCLPRGLRRPPRPPLFPYTTLFRSQRRRLSRRHAGARAQPGQAGRGGAAAAALSADPCAGHVVGGRRAARSEEHTSELQSRENLVCRLLLEKKNSGTSTAQREHGAG